MHARITGSDRTITPDATLVTISTMIHLQKARNSCPNRERGKHEQQKLANIFEQRVEKTRLLTAQGHLMFEVSLERFGQDIQAPSRR